MNKYLLFLLFIFTSMSWSQDKPTRWIDLEWDEVEEAKGYDISLSELIDGKEFPRGIFHTEIPHFSKEENPGKYLIRIRALDKRKVPGQWGEAIPFNVSFQNPQLLFPTVDLSLIKDENKPNEIVFQWTNINGAKNYLLVLKDQKNEVIYQRILSTNTAKVMLDKIGRYSWNVITLENESASSPKTVKCDQIFYIKGEKLRSPILDFDVTNPKGIIVKWNEISRAEQYSYSLNSLEGDNEKQFFQSTTKKTTIGIPADKIPNQKWFISVKAIANHYTESNDSRAIFKQKELISNESQYNELNFRKLNPSKLSFAIGFPNFNYKNTNFETDTINMEKLRGINLSLEHSLSFNEMNNFFSSIEIAQIADPYSALNIVEAEFQFRRIFGNRYFNGQLGGGIKLKSLSNLSSNRLEAIKTTKSTPSLNLGMVLSFQLNKKWNEQFENEFYIESSKSLTSLKDSKNFSSSLDYSLNFKTMYNINSNFNINLNYKIKSLNNAYKAQIGNSSFALAGDINKTEANSNYLLFGSEYFY